MTLMVMLKMNGIQAKEMITQPSDKGEWILGSHLCITINVTVKK